jgi:START domain
VGALSNLKQGTWRSAARVLGLCALTLTSQAGTARGETPPGRADTWQVIETSQRGIVVRKRGSADATSDASAPREDALDAFQGEGVIRGNVLQVLAVVLDANQVEHWAYGITDASRLTGDGTTQDELLYLYSDTPWPVRDRDMVVRREVEVMRPAESFRVRMRCVAGGRPQRDNVVRVRRCESSFTLTRATDDTTHVVYETELDPAGSVPGWASRWVAKNAPLRTLEALERRASSSDGRYAAVVQHWSKAL